MDTAMISTPEYLATTFYIEHGEILCNSFNSLAGSKQFHGFTGLISNIIDAYNAPFAIVSHGIETDPIFNFGNKIALELFNYNWEDFTATPSRKSAESMERAARAALLKMVSTQGFIDNYSGVRISSDGCRFLIENALIWNLFDENGCYCGQAAAFNNWTMLKFCSG